VVNDILKLEQHTLCMICYMHEPDHRLNFRSLSHHHFKKSPVSHTILCTYALLTNTIKKALFLSLVPLTTVFCVFEEQNYG
jgi:hypothetical protein